MSDENIEEKRKVSIKYADSGVKFNNFEDETNNNDNEITIQIQSTDDTNKNNKNKKDKDKDKFNTYMKNRKMSILNSNKNEKDEKKSTENQNQFENSIPLKKASLTPSLSAPQNKRGGRRYSTMQFMPVKNSRITSDSIGDDSIKHSARNDLSSRQSHYSDSSNQFSSKYSFNIKEFIPQRGLLYSEFQSFNCGWELCKPKILPLKSIEIQKIEKMEKAAFKARQNTGIRLTRTTSANNNIEPKIRSNEVHTSPDPISTSNN
ncbi:hypothetical protein BCR32DRAFT_325153 [Anaeromyces robustus]|uniref:Uncharacterized protein n=1 Tax=Anaeromyces robustus TaxID=1754192 RepID=A0A1Y1XK11_9FUNG|nr:hypothetical protein BCR32DRAFT_325153 [Anaeromyces robustus]|eukprot:ORX86052.1 hypothetical protein BCR32DRAFT_325153 [Anaeromyces robustus]